eukprot:1246549-Prymnesium_polylepis.1
MNRHGAILSDLGFTELLNSLAERVIGPLGRHLYPQARWHGFFRNDPPDPPTALPPTLLPPEALPLCRPSLSVCRARGS